MWIDKFLDRIFKSSISIYFEKKIIELIAYFVSEMFGPGPASWAGWKVPPVQE